MTPEETNHITVSFFGEWYLLKFCDIMVPFLLPAFRNARYAKANILSKVRLRLPQSKEPGETKRNKTRISNPKQSACSEAVLALSKGRNCQS